MTEFVYLKGKAKWFKHLKPEEFRGKTTWKHTIYLDDESLEKVRDLQSQGIKNVLKKDEDGYYTSFSRPTKMVWTDKTSGERKTSILEPPIVRLKNGNAQLTESVGNGSVIETKLEVYSHGVPGGGKAKAARWLASRIDSLVPIRSEQTVVQTEDRALKGLETADGGW